MFPLALLALLALLTFWIQRTVQPPAPKLDGSNRHDPDYILNNFVTTRTDTLGNLRYKLVASEMKHYPDDDSTELQHPHFTRYAPGKPYTQVEGQRGFVSSDGENIQFMDNVRVVREASKDRGEMVVLTEFLNVEPKKDLVTTDRPVVITQAPKTVIHAIGMVYNKKLQTVKLLKNVRVHYERADMASEPQTLEPQSDKAAVQTLKTTGQSNAETTQTDKKTKAGKASANTSTKKTRKNSLRKNAKKKTTPKQNTTRIRRQYEQAATP
ncbi:MAG TPA: LPS export ABC transporter periplasmic protein LptC [Methylophilaceae bacterium]|nr:LPS export ABC transporter periplasmic protein LptC [Methylophilaceae bacterium]